MPGLDHANFEGPPQHGEEEPALDLRSEGLQPGRQRAEAVVDVPELLEPPRERLALER